MHVRPDVSVAHVDHEEMAVFSHGRVEEMAESDADWARRWRTGPDYGARPSVGRKRSCSTATGRTGWSATRGRGRALRKRGISP